jgi:hypothetical protein
VSSSLGRPTFFLCCDRGRRPYQAQRACKPTLEGTLDVCDKKCECPSVNVCVTQYCNCFIYVQLQFDCILDIYVVNGSQHKTIAAEVVSGDDVVGY